MNLGPNDSKKKKKEEKKIKEKETARTMCAGRTKKRAYTNLGVRRAKLTASWKTDAVFS